MAHRFSTNSHIWMLKFQSLKEKYVCSLPGFSDRRGLSDHSERPNCPCPPEP